MLFIASTRPFIALFVSIYRSVVMVMMMAMLGVILGLILGMIMWLILSVIMSLVVSWIVRLVSMIHYRPGKRLISFQLIFFDGMNWRYRSAFFLLIPRFLFFKINVHSFLHLIHLMVIDPIPSILQPPIFCKFPKSMTEVVLEVAYIEKSVLVVNFPVSAFLIIFVFTSVLNSCLHLFEISFTVT
jgi:hypothetical protein